MQSKRPSNKHSSQLADIRVGTDKGSLRLQFSTKVSQQFYGKRQAYKGLGRSDTPENQQWADGIARRIQADIDHPDGGLFDPTLAKYMDIKPMLATVTHLPTARALPTLRELWDEFVEWRLKTQQIGESTYIGAYKDKHEHTLRPFMDKPFDEVTANEIITELNSRTKNRKQIKTLYGILSRLCQWAINKKSGVSEDYFSEIKSSYRLPKKSKQVSEQEDFVAYTKDERDLIINSFYASDRKGERILAPLVEFLFLTGCRHGEAFALQWKDIKFDTGWIVFDESYSTHTKVLMKDTKTGVIRWFKMKGMNRLIDLLKNLYGEDKNPNDLVFTYKNERCDTYKIGTYWQGTNVVRPSGKSYQIPGVVTQLVQSGQLAHYLKPYSTRHTFISIQANNGTDLALLADSCGNSVDIIIKHYLQPDRERVLLDI
ncbi:MAG: tyrosine-type recombinase/integrase [Nostoc sp. DedQUE08]|uniref:tyrosine-type recombinase/integrase n=1 Tax=Nostoc sp. DedQUE08 TaxID=3075393 RepID=UPI002AD3DAF1|nr:tyrosine-type recombinase/integrase [Nostoc sp. DedQUE08]MDZ8064124.1 tyrosine-type recombinase/integrase [Nostoc sp. DedQUE08]